MNDFNMLQHLLGVLFVNHHSLNDCHPRHQLWWPFSEGLTCLIKQTQQHFRTHGVIFDVTPTLRREGSPIPWKASTFESMCFFVETFIHGYLEGSIPGLVSIVGTPHFTGHEKRRGSHKPISLRGRNNDHHDSILHHGKPHQNHTIRDPSFRSRHAMRWCWLAWGSTPWRSQLCHACDNSLSEQVEGFTENRGISPPGRRGEWPLYVGN